MGLTEKEIEEFSNRFDRRYALKKRTNALICFFITFSGMSAVLYSMFVFHNSLFDRMRYMTFWGTIFTSVVSFIFGIMCLKEASSQTEFTYRPLYFLRLSSATTECVIVAVVLFGLTGLVSDRPDVTSYPGIMMHLVVPFAMVISFLLNDPPFGRPKPIEPFKGTIFIAIYAVVMTMIFGMGILPSTRAPYSFLDFERTSVLFKVECLIGIFAVGYAVSWLLMRLNMKLSWIWFYDIKRMNKRG